MSIPSTQPQLSDSCPPSHSALAYMALLACYKYPGDMVGYVARKRDIEAMGRLENVVLSL
jgi:hypothetical protein